MIVKKKKRNKSLAEIMMVGKKGTPIFIQSGTAKIFLGYRIATMSKKKFDELHPS